MHIYLLHIITKNGVEDEICNHHSTSAEGTFLENKILFLSLGGSAISVKYKLGVRNVLI